MYKMDGFNLSSSDKQLSLSTIETLKNFRFSEDGTFINDRGTEALKLYTSGDDSKVYTSTNFEPMRFFRVWKRHNKAETYYFYEQDGYLRYCWGNGDATAGDDLQTIDSGRHIPSHTEPGTQLIELGNICLFVNGIDIPYKFYGGDIKRRFGYYAIPPAPKPFNIDTLFPSTSAFANAGSVCPFISTAGTLKETLWGITKTSESDNFNIGYKVSFVDDTGSESPLSEEGVLSFSTVAVAAKKGNYVAMVQIPIGPGSTVARRLYRRKFRSDNSIGAGDYFFVKQIDDNASEFVSDHYPDFMLSTYAPGYPYVNAGHTIVPIKNFNYGCIYDGRLWIAGNLYNNVVIYSAQSKYAQFEAQNFVPLGNGGSVTGLVSFEGRLYIFRENSIDYVQRQVDGSYLAGTISNEVGTVATNTIKIAGNAGLVFLASDGVYSIRNGGLSKISGSIDKFFRRLTYSAMPRATAVYNPIDKEYWCHLPIDGKTDNSHGIVLHSNGFWSYRGPGSGRAFDFTHLDFDGDHTVMATKPWDSTDSVNPLNGTWRNLEIMVWSSADQYSDVWDSGQSSGGGYTFTKSSGSKSQSIIETKWLTLGDPSIKKSVKSIELVCLGIGESLPLSYAVDGKYDFTSVTAAKTTHSEYRSATAGDAAYENTTKYDGTYGTSIANGYRRVHHRYDISTLEVNSIKLKVSTSNLTGIIGLVVYYEPSNTRNHNA